MLTAAAQQFCWRLLYRTEDERRRDVFAVLDGAQVKVLPDRIVHQKSEHACLLAAESDPMTLIRAPYLVRLADDSETTRWLLEEGWGKHWGIFLLCPAGTALDTVLRDIRELLQARLPDGRVVKFRFYDPRIWRVFYPTCDEAQLKKLHGRVIQEFACEDAGGGALLLDSMQNGGPSRQIRPLPE